MKLGPILRRLGLITIAAIAAFAMFTRAARAQSLGDLNGELNAIQGQMSGALSSDSAAGSTVDRLDKAEQDFAKLASGGKADKSALIPAYNQLESMLTRIYETYKKKKDDCIASMDSGGQCDYDTPEKVSLQAAYPLSWLRFQGATTLFNDNATQSQKMLNEAIDGFTESTLVIVEPELVRENLLGRAFCERELGKFDHSEYDKALADFQKIMDDGSATAQYKAARQGMATTYMAMGQPEKAQKYVEGTTNTSGGQMFQLQALFQAEKATSDPAKKAQIHKQIVDAMQSKENDKEGFAIDVGAASKYSFNAIEEFGNGSPFEKWLLANVLLGRKDDGGAAKYFAEAAATGKYPKGYKFAADIYLKQKRFDEVDAMLNQISRGSGADAQWAEYMKYSLARQRWEQGGSKDAKLEDDWANAAQAYLQKYPAGEYSAELAFRLGERLQKQGKYMDAAKVYDSIKGNNEYSFTAKFSSALCKYKVIGEAESKDYKGPKVDIDSLKKDTMTDLQDTLKMAPEAERSAGGGQKKFVHDTHGSAVYMLAGLLKDSANPDYAQIAQLTTGFEREYPGLSDRFHDIVEWRIAALDHLGRYDEVQRDVAQIVEKNKGSTEQSDFIKELGLDFWRAAQAADASGDNKTYIANAKLTATAYTYFADNVASGKSQAKNLTGTLSILGQAYQALGDQARAETIFNQVVKADAASPDANAGLARIAQAKKDWKDGITYWTNVENTAAESDNLWYEAKYNIAVISNEQGNLQGACSKLAQTRAEHPTLGSPEMKVKWDALQRKLCLH